MPNGQQIARENYQAFLDWIDGKTDADFRMLVRRGLLNRVEIAKEIGFAKSVLAQNPDVKKTLLNIEEELRGRGVLPPKTPVTDDESAVLPLEASGQRRALDQARIRRLEQDIAAVQAERDLWRDRAERYESLDRILIVSGRVPR